MNERIEQLVNQVTRIRELYYIGPVHRDAVEYFAELIVNECVTVVQSYRTKMDASNENIVVAIQNHFGVSNERTD